ncbi:MAG: organic solvent tolerance protein OstA [Treponemataceae bacterium]|nr:organic solvent tolerance protein OstA [Treponemataceae bacterium]
MKKTTAVLLFFLLFSMTFPEAISFKASRMTGNAGENKQLTELSGNAWVKTTDMEIYADKITLSGNDYEKVVAEGNVRGEDTKSGFSFSCGRLTFNRNSGIARLQDDVALDDKPNEVKATAGIIEYDRTTETAVLQINIKLEQKNSVCTSALAVYRKNEQTLEMNGNPVVVRGKDTFRAQTIFFDLETQEIVLDGRVSGTVTEGEN